MKRLGILCLYDELGKLHEADRNMVADLNENVSELIVVINGAMEEAGVEKVRQITSRVYKRPNVGMDIGAYKDVLIDYLEEDIADYDELVLCNNSFFGPFAGFDSLFEEINNQTCDFWGINFDDRIAFQFMESYFLVFGKKIIKSGELVRYIKENIDSQKDTYRDVCVKFETGFFTHLVEECGYNYSTYCPFSNLNMIVSGNFGVKKYNMPIVKRKFIQNIDKYYDNVMDALQYIDLTYDYDITLLIDKMNSLYECGLSLSQVRDYRVKTENLVEVFQQCTNTVKSQIEEFINSYKKIYLYGAGVWGYVLYWLYLREKDNFCGFIISDKEDKMDSQVYGWPIYKFSAVQQNPQTGILLGLNKENTAAVIPLLPDRSNYLSLWNGGE